MRITVLGASGFVGQHVSQLIEARHPSATLTGLGSREFDLKDPSTWEMPDDAQDLVIHFAAYTGPDAAEHNSVNAESAPALAEYLSKRGDRRLLYISTGAVYGATSDATSPVTHQPSPNNEYGRSKLEAEHAFRERFRGELAIARLYFPFGIGQTRPRLVPNLIHSVREGLPISCATDGGPRLTLTAVTDIGTRILRDFASGSFRTGIYNLASDQTVSIRQLATLIGETVGKKVNFETVDQKPDVLSQPYDKEAWIPVNQTAIENMITKTEVAGP